jgi:hypothetical protein
MSDLLDKYSASLGKENIAFLRCFLEVISGNNDMEQLYEFECWIKTKPIPMEEWTGLDV